MQDRLKTGVLLINLGTPEACDVKSVRIFLREFLMDKRVIDLPAPLRWLLVNGAILPGRSRKTAEAYRKIWTGNGSPLLENSLKLKEKLASILGEYFQVALGMRYGSPSILTALQTLLTSGCHKIIILPLFPQYASATNGSAIAKSLAILQKLSLFPEIEIINHFFNDNPFIEAWRQVVNDNYPAFEPESWIFSFHGLPLRQLNTTGCSIQQCLQHANHCSPTAKSITCYRHQCFSTAHAIAQTLGLNADRYRIAFQSRLGRLPWLPPYLDRLLPELAEQGIKRIAVICPSFVADCLETLEEIGLRANEQWRQLGGTHFSLLPSLNTHPAWIKALAQLIKK